MTSLSTIDLLNRVLVVHNRSLPRYLCDAVPYFKYGQHHRADTLDAIARDQVQVVDRIGSYLTDQNAVYNLGEYPMVFTAYHDVSFEWILPVLIDRQRRMINYLQHCAEQLNLAPMAKALVEETVGMAKGHLEMLEELKASPASNGSSSSADNAAVVAH
jgi:hypothetical protein